MRIKFTFDLPEGKIELPIHYNHIVQAMIYANISDTLADFIHNEGFRFEKRTFKLFTFSRLMGKHRVRKAHQNKNKAFSSTTITYDSPLSFYLSSPYEDILQEFANRTVAGTSIRMGRHDIFIASVRVLFPPAVNESALKIKMLSPMAVRSTLYDKTGARKTYYYSPLEKEFPELISRNILKKYYSFNGCYPEDREFVIRPFLFAENKNLRKMNYKGFVIKAYDGIYELSGSKELIGFAYDCGLGERNSQGCGMFEVWEK